jgi:hypothetical protein
MVPTVMMAAPPRRRAIVHSTFPRSRRKRIREDAEAGIEVLLEIPAPPQEEGDLGSFLPQLERLEISDLVESEQDLGSLPGPVSVGKIEGSSTHLSKIRANVRPLGESSRNAPSAPPLRGVKGKPPVSKSSGARAVHPES